MRALALLLLSSPAFAGDNAGVPDRLAALEARVYELEADRDACRADLDALAEEADAQAEDLDALDEEVGTLASVVDAAVLDVAGYTELLEEVLARVPVHEPDWTNMNDRLDGVEIELAEVREVLGGLLDCLGAWLQGEDVTCGGDDAGDAETDPNGN